MAYDDYDESLALRIRLALARKKNIEEKKLFGGVWKEFLIARIGPDHGDEPHVRKMDITGKPMQG